MNFPNNGFLYALLCVLAILAVLWLVGIRVNVG